MSSESGSRGPVDPRLWRHSRAARGYLMLTVGVGVVTAAAVIVSALMIGTILAGVITDPAARTVAAWTTQLLVLAGAVAVRVGSTWAQTRYSHRAALDVVAELKGQVLEAAAAADPRALAPRRERLATVLTRGLDGLRPYLTGYLPALGLALTVTPATLLVIALQDLTSAVIIFVTLPLVPIFMILIGLLTRGTARARLETMTRLSAQLLDLLAGLPTLRALGRERGPAARVRELGEAHRRSTMAALRYAFLSAMVLELLATLCVALVAVSIGLRLVYGGMGLAAGVIALILAAEVYLPLRAIGAQFHAAEDGVAAADEAFLALEELPAKAFGTHHVSPGPVAIRLEGLGVHARSGLAPHGLDASCQPGLVTVLTGANGAGKSTALAAVLGLTAPDEGRVLIGGRDIAELNPQSWWANLAWLPQRPALIPGTLAENLGADVADPRVAAACARTGFDIVLAETKDGWDTLVGAGGEGISLGQRQRLALTRTLLSDAPVLLLDEPTAHLDAAAEAVVLGALTARARAGATVVIVGHRPAVLAIADEVVEVRAQEVAHAV
ncbi:thiol reductant ABC exporter subunit CydD [Tomitella biformata]|uniref:thiol reductant ABC exporter subunit CydD n=1 Tax=Tomitella biformata TaxID=630403 RepID=UPI000467E351|nr:thiol reductant ABC exporter subunit CydD [Tomitella biformata]